MIRNVAYAFAYALTVLAPVPSIAGVPAIAAQGEASAQILVMLRSPPRHFRAGGNYAGGYGGALSRSALRNRAAQLARRHGLSLVDSWSMPVLAIDCVVMRVPSGATAQDTAARVASDPVVLWSEPMQIYSASAAPLGFNDPLAPAQPAVRRWQLGQLQQAATGKGVRVAVIDSRIDSTHPDLAGRVTADVNFVTGDRRLAAERHGTEVAGIIAARAHNRIGIAGIAPDSSLLALRACRQEEGSSATWCDSFSLAKAMQFAIQSRAHVINLSLTGPRNRLLEALVDAALVRGITVVGAVDSRSAAFPGSARGVIAVADGSLKDRGAGVLVAPGRGVPTTKAGGGWGLADGSSFATAHVSGLFALVRERDGGRTPRPLARTAKGDVDPCATMLGGAHSCADTD